MYNSGSFVPVVAYWLAERNVPEANRKVNGVFHHVQTNVTGVDQMDHSGLVQFFFLMRKLKNTSECVEKRFGITV